MGDIPWTWLGIRASGVTAWVDTPAPASAAATAMARTGMESVGSFIGAPQRGCN